MERIVKTVLPPDSDGVIRNFAIEHTGHGDIRLEFWNGDTKPSILAWMARGIENPYPRYSLLHTNHGLLMAALMGYLTRTNTPETDIEEILHEARTCIDAKKPRYEAVSALNELVSQGASFSRYDIPEKGWLALTRPIVTQPGAGIVGGTEFFTTETAELVIAMIDDEVDGAPYISGEHATTLTIRDVSPIATAIAKISLGESVDTIGTLFAERFDKN